MFILASDYDNTLNAFDYDLKLNIFFLKKFMNKGNVFLLNTGRPYESIKREIKKFNIPYNYLSCNDGNILFNSSNQIIYSSNLNLDIYEDLKKLQEEFNLKIELIKFNNNLLEFELMISKVNELFFLKLSKIMIKYNLCNKVFKKFGFYHIYVYSRFINKSTPIEYLRKKYNVEKEKIYTIGDHINDLEMIRDYNGYAMKWALKEVKSEALETCFSVASLIKKIER